MYTRKSREMKVKSLLIFVEAGVYGGAELYVINLVKYATKNDIRITVCFCHHDMPQYESALTKAGANVIKVDFPLAYQRNPFSIKGFKILKAVMALIKRCNPDVIVLNKCATWMEFRLVILASMLLRTGKIIGVEHHHPEGWEVYAPRRYPPKNLHVRQEIDKVLCYFFSRRHDVLICMNKVAKNTLIEEYFYPKQKLHHVYNGTDIEHYSFSRHDRKHCRNKINKSDNDFIVMSSCRHTVVKGLDILIRAIAHLPVESIKFVTVVLLGDGPEHENLKTLAHECGVNENIIFLGMQTDVASWLSAADVYVSSSRQESFGISIIEAMSMGLCVIGTHVGGVPEVITDAGILIKSDSVEALSEAITLVMNDKAHRISLAKKSRRRVRENFTIEMSMNKTFELINNAL